MANENEIIEEWDWEKGVPTGKKIHRAESHLSGLAHEGVHLWIFRTIKEQTELLFQKRADHKEMYPGYLDITVGGHVPYGITKNKIQKESYEEIGISPDDEDLIDLGWCRYEEKADGFFHREFQRVYLLKDNRALSEYKFTDGEVDGIYAFPLNDVDLLLKKNIEIHGQGFDGNRITYGTFSKINFHPLLFSHTMTEYMRIIITGIKEFSELGMVNSKMPNIDIAQ